MLFRFNDVLFLSLSWFLGVADFSCGYSALTFWDTTNAKYLYSCLRYPALTAISLFLSSLRPFTFFGGFSPRKVLVLDLGPVLGHNFFLCIYSSHHLSGCRKKIPPCYAVYGALTRYCPKTHDSLLRSPILPPSPFLRHRSSPGSELQEQQK